ncbi:hypothetical protein AVEN_73829-1 [Araneus ventricosus]|uniref:Uncharacterized protein n=1 Tax=Araneus ventricosus TaxID=182803 RepID=A0A4Y2SZ62_ARAVE|nr:hypothetical protein AVEN_73829-1 [Araneus ventricosus]
MFVQLYLDIHQVSWSQEEGLLKAVQHDTPSKQVYHILKTKPQAWSVIEDPAARKRRSSREKFALWRARQCQETLNRIQTANNENSRRGRDRVTEEEMQKRLEADAEYRERID